MTGQVDKKIIRIRSKTKPGQGLIQPGNIRIFVYCEETKGELEGTYSLFKTELEESKTFDEVKNLLEKKSFTMPKCPVCSEKHVWNPPYEILWEHKFPPGSAKD